MKEFTDEQWQQIHDYLKSWCDTDGMRDINLAIDSGDTVAALDILVSAGAIEGIGEISKLCLEAHKSLTKKEIQSAYDDTFGDCVSWEDENGYIQFTKNKYIDYLLTDEECVSYGWIKQ